MALKSLLVITGLMSLLLQSHCLESFCVKPYVKIAEMCYNFHQTAMNWNSADAQCKRDGANLGSVLTPLQYNGLLAHINKHYPGTYWISGIPRNGQWLWGTTGTPMTPGWWGNGRVPAATQGSCSYFCSITLRYWAKSCTNPLRFICEKNPITMHVVSPEQTADRIEDLPQIIAQ